MVVSLTTHDYLFGFLFLTLLNITSLFIVYNVNFNLFSFFSFFFFLIFIFCNPINILVKVMLSYTFSRILNFCKGLIRVPVGVCSSTDLIRPSVLLGKHLMILASFHSFFAKFLSLSRTTLFIKSCSLGVTHFFLMDCERRYWFRQLFQKENRTAFLFFHNSLKVMAEEALV